MVGLGYLLFATFSGALHQTEGLTRADQQRILENLTLTGRVALVGVAALVIAFCWLFIEEEWLGYLLLLVAALLYWGLPFLIMEFQGTPNPSSKRFHDLPGYAILQIRNLAWVLLPPGVLLAVYSAGTRGIRRLRYGSTLDQTLRIGSSVKAQQAASLQRFLGKCWQLPFCRDFLRQRCPIYHARRTCWRERVGCMCEERTIMNALVNVRLHSDPQQNAKFIPYNKQLTMEEKKERCRNCVIYNEHQRQKYQLLAPVTLGSVVAAAYFFQEQLHGLMFESLQRVDQLLARFSLGPASVDPRVLEATFKANEIAATLLYVCLVTIVLSYLLRLLETAIFTWKI